MASTVLALMSSLVFLNPRYMLLSIGLLVIHISGCFLGTAIWEVMNILGDETISISVDNVKNVKKGRDWARNGVRMIIPLYTLAINKISPREIISFEAPDEVTGGDVVYALMFWEEEDAICIEKHLGSMTLG